MTCPSSHRKAFSVTAKAKPDGWNIPFSLRKRLFRATERALSAHGKASSTVPESPYR